MTDAATTTSRRAELEEERDFLLRSLDDLDREHEAGDLADDDLQTLKADYTARAAAVLRKLQSLDGAAGAAGDAEGKVAARPAATRRTGAAKRPSRRPRWPLLLSIAATVALAGGAGYLVTQSAGERLPGQESSGGPERGPRALLQQAIDMDNGGQLVEAARLYDAVLAEDPENVLALTRRGWVLGRSGRQAGNVELLQAGLGYLDRATTIDPSFPDAHAFKGLVLGALKRPAEAVCEFRAWLAIAPIADPQRGAIEGVHDEALKQAGGTVDGCPKPPVPVPVDGVPAAPGPPGDPAHDPAAQP
jgi:tetratricopeptide (TPR) repeat protein